MYNRTKEWIHFSDQVDRHIIHYTLPQYGNTEGDEQIDTFTTDQIKSQLQRYVTRIGSSVRGTQEQLRDCLKIAHYAQFLYNKLQLLTGQEDLYKDEDQA